MLLLGLNSGKGIKMRKQITKIREFLDIYFFRMILGTPARMYYGNDAGVKVNRAWKKRLKLVKSIGINAPSDDRAIVLASQGFVSLGYPFDVELVNKIKRHFSELITLQESDGKNMASREVKPAALQIPELKKLLTPDIIKIASAYYGDNRFEVSHVTAWRNYYLGKSGLSKDLYSNLWHNDQSPVGTIKMFLFLSDGVSRNNGATKVLNIAQTKRVMRTGYFERKYIYGPARKYLKDESNFTFLEGESGFVFIFNPQLAVHAAGLVAEGKIRDVAVITIRPSEKSLRHDWEVSVIEADQNYMQKTSRM